MANEAYHSSEYYRQQRNMLLNGDPRALICFCVDVSQSMDEWWIQPGGLTRYTGSGFYDGHNVNHFDLRDINDKVAISIIVYSRYGKVLYDFTDSKSIDIRDCVCRIGENETSMGDGLRTSLSQIDEMENDLRQVGKDAYTPLLVFMTDGMPTDDPRLEFAEVRRRVEEGELHIFPLGIGEGADMSRLRDMFPVGRVPVGFSERYKMIRPENYVEMFSEIKRHVSRRQSVMVSEGDSIQSAPVLDDETVSNNQTGESLLDDISQYI